MASRSRLSSYIFNTQPDDSLKCCICFDLASCPLQHEVCGKLFCSECIEKNGKKPCPMCREENPKYFKDKRGEHFFSVSCIANFKHIIHR